MEPKLDQFRFARLGGVDQVLFTSGEDVVSIGALDQKLWVALACPIEGVFADRRTLELFDTDKDGRIRAVDLVRATAWVRSCLKRYDGVARSSAEISLAAVDERSDTGQQILRAAREILKTGPRSAGGPETLGLDEVKQALDAFAAGALNGDGIVPPEGAPSEDLKVLFEDIVRLIGGDTDRSGKPGVNLAKLDAFFADAEAWSTWFAKAEDPSLCPFGARTSDAFQALKAVEAKIEDYFARVRLAEFDGRVVAALNRDESELASIAKEALLGAKPESVLRLPLAAVAASRPLPLRTGVNPAWREALSTFAELAVRPVLGDVESIDSEGFNKVREALRAHSVWWSEKPASKTEALGRERVRAVISGDLRGRAQALLASDAANAGHYADLEALEKLLRFQRDLKELAENFVSLATFYAPEGLASFQVGSLYMDGRMTDLCVAVEDLGKHSALSGNSRIFNAYCEIVRKATGQRRTICAGFTAGFGNTLFVGRNGIFYDREGNDWDATIVKVLEAPISLREAFWAPWRKVGSMIGQQVGKILAAKEAAAQTAASKSIETAGAKVADASATSQAAPGAPPGPAAGPQTAMGGAAIASAVAALGIAVGFLSTAATGLLSVVTGVPIWKTLLGLVGLLFIVSGPSVAIAYFRLRARDVAPLLNASGWAINGRLLLTMKLGRLLTTRAELPKGATRSFRDPYADSTAGRNLLLVLAGIVILVVGLWYGGVLGPWLEAILHSSGAPPSVDASAGPTP